MLMAVGALDPMDIVGALWIEVGRVHFFHIEFAFAFGRVAGGAGSASVFVVPVMAGDATESFMHAGGSAVVACPDLRTPVMVARQRYQFRECVDRGIGSTSPAEDPRSSSPGERHPAIAECEATSL